MLGCKKIIFNVKKVRI